MPELASDDEHTPPFDPIPPSEMRRYRTEGDPDSEADIARYVEIETGGEQVHHVERVKTAHVLGIEYVVWDVVTEVEQYWVLTDSTNLYPRKYFPTLDFVLSFHVGLMMRMRDRPYGDRSEEPSPFAEVFRRQEQARVRFDDAHETEDMQAVGLLLRECLIALVAATRLHIDSETESDQPKGDDFIGWTELVYDQLCSGGSREILRKHIKATAKTTWQLVNSLTHGRSADTTAITIALHSCDALVGHTDQLLGRHRTGGIERCPLCKSREIRSHFDPDILPAGDYYMTCWHCAWDTHPEAQSPDGVHAALYSPAVEVAPAQGGEKYG